MDSKDLLGMECIIEHEGDDNRNVKIKSFIASYDESKGMTIKALDPERCPEWMMREKDGSVNVFCFDLTFLGHQRMMPLIIKHLIRYKALSRKQNRKLRGIGDFGGGPVQASCVF